MRHVIATIGRSLLATAAISLLAGAVGLTWLHLHGEQLLAVQSDSMRPVFASGDAVFVKRTNTFSAGQIMSFHDPAQPSVIVSHRIVGRDHGSFVLAGDAQPEVQQIIAPDQAVGRVVAVAPGVGRVLNALHQPLVLAVFIYVPAMALIMSELGRLRKRLAPSGYQLFPGR
jgi:signal peptidase I